MTTLNHRVFFSCMLFEDACAQGTWAAPPAVLELECAGLAFLLIIEGRWKDSVERACGFTAATEHRVFKWMEFGVFTDCTQATQRFTITAFPYLILLIFFPIF